MISQTLKKITIHRVIFPFRINFSHNLASRSEAETLLVVVETMRGSFGYGQALPREYLTGETLESVVEAIRNSIWPEILRVDMPSAGDLPGLLSLFRPIFHQADRERANAAYAAVEVAIMDALLKDRGLPAWFSGLCTTGKLPLVGVIGAEGARKAAWFARIFRWLGYSRFKVKVGKDRDADGRRLAAVRAVTGRGAWLAADANCAWEYDEAVDRMRELTRFGVSVVEEPLRAECREGVDYRELENASGAAIMADESLCTVADADRLLQQGSPSWWNLRLAKNGGLSGMDILSQKARDTDVSVYGGILVGETGILASAGRVGMFMAGAVCGEYGFSRFFLKGDPFRGSPTGYFGKLAVPAGAAGFGTVLAQGAGNAPGKVVWEDSCR